MTYRLMARIIERRGKADIDVGIASEMCPGYWKKREGVYGPLSLVKVIEYTDGNGDERVYEFYKREGFGE